MTTPAGRSGYLVCKHINAPSDVAHFEVATHKSLGVISCSECYKRRKEEDYTLVNSDVWCAGCARETGLLVTVQ